jgi:hypothetical protein
MGFFDLLWNNITSAEYWAGELPSYAVLTVLIGIVTSQAAKRLEKRRLTEERRPYENWKLRIVGYDHPDQDLYFEDVRRLKNSDFEMFKFLKSTCTTICEIKTKALPDAKDVWFFEREEGPSRYFIVDFNRLPHDQLGAWRREAPRGRTTEAPATPRPAEA